MLINFSFIYLTFLYLQLLIHYFMVLLKRISFSLLGLLLVTLVASTVIGKIYGSNVAAKLIYDSIWFVLLWVLFSVSSLLYILSRNLIRRVHTFLLHLSFIIILAGAYVTWLYGESGSIHLRNGESSNFFIDSKGYTHIMPFNLRLDEFVKEYYSNSSLPKDYVSHISVRDKHRVSSDKISMNKPFIFMNYRFCQGSYDDDGKGSALLVSYDPYGIMITYIGYMFLLITMLLFFLDRQSRFRQLIKARIFKRGTTFVILMSLAFSLQAQTYTHENALVEVYDSVRFLKPLSIALIVSGVICFVYYCRQIIFGRTLSSILSFTLNIFLGVLFFFISTLLGIRWYIINSIPLSTGFETMLFMAWIIILLTLFIQRRFKMIMPFGLLVGGLAMLIASLFPLGSELHPVRPVLASPLLSIHVITIMTAYALLSFVTLDGIAASVIFYSNRKRRVEVDRLRIISEIILYPAIFLLAFGIFTGAVWANISWGRYWGWDPKEVWALITFLLYSLAIHSDSLPWFRKSMFFHIFCIVAFAAVLITYFGVNFLLGGMHGYV